MLSAQKRIVPSLLFALSFKNLTASRIQVDITIEISNLPPLNLLITVLSMQPSNLSVVESRVTSGTHLIFTNYNHVRYIVWVKTYSLPATAIGSYVHMLPEIGYVYAYICYQFRSKGDVTSITSTSGDRFFLKLVAISIFSCGLSIGL
jgi:hypothetical protein